MMVKGFDTRILICSKCKEEFVLTADAQQYLAEHGKTDNLRLCRACYTEMKKAERSRDTVAEVGEVEPVSVCCGSRDTDLA